MLGVATYSVIILYLESVELAVEVDGEHEDAEDDANGVEDEELWDQNSEWDLESELGLVDNNQRQTVSWRHSDYFLI